MEMINRSAVILRPKQPYLDWIKLDDDTGIAEAVFKTMLEEPTVYLLPEFEDDLTQQEVLHEFWPALFEAMLEGWIRVESMWPKGRTFEMFQDWFEVQMLATVEDLFIDEQIEYLD